MKTKKESSRRIFRVCVCKDEAISCGTYLKDVGLSLGILTPDGDSFVWQRFLRKLKDGDLLEIKQISKEGSGKIDVVEWMDEKDRREILGSGKETEKQ